MSKQKDSCQKEREVRREHNHTRVTTPNTLKINNQVLRQHAQVKTKFQIIEIAVQMHIKKKLMISNK
jgi:hypothetical protein